MMTDRLTVKAFAWPASVPLFGLALAGWGQVKEQASVIAIVFGAVVVLWGLVLLAFLGLRLVRKRLSFGVAVGLALAGAAIFADVALVIEAPLWVRDRAAPAIAAIEADRTDRGSYPRVNSLDGDFPRPLREALDASGHCVYRPRAVGYHLSCLSVPFSKCGYDGATRRWSGWE